MSWDLHSLYDDGTLRVAATAPELGACALLLDGPAGLPARRRRPA